jgi:sulfate adenylyltransferase subunit 1 (EFTu-like GTPase family)
MLNKNEAKNLAMNYILQIWNLKGDKPIILDKYTIEKAFGWVFFYSSKKYEETGKISYALAGNAPIIVNKFDGSLHITGTAFETDHYIAEYEANLLA